jgi:hypothetical protein
MRLSRSMLFLVSALALPVVAAGGCGDDSGDSNDKPSDQPSDNGGEVVVDSGKKDAGLSKMDATVKPGSNSDVLTDSGTASDSGSPLVDAGAAIDAGSEGIDAGTDASAPSDAGKVDAKVDAGEIDASEAPQKDAAKDPQKDAANEPERDAAGDTGTPDGGSRPTEDPITEQVCAAGNGALKDEASQCEDGQKVYPVIGSEQVCCGPKDAPAEGACSKDVRCPNAQFCDYSKSGGGNGCDDPKQAGKCRQIPNDTCDGVPLTSGGCGCDGFPHTACDGWKLGISVEFGDYSCFGLPAP